MKKPTTKTRSKLTKKKTKKLIKPKITKVKKYKTKTPKIICDVPACKRALYINDKPKYADWEYKDTSKKICLHHIHLHTDENKKFNLFKIFKIKKIKVGLDKFGDPLARDDKVMHLKVHLRQQEELKLKKAESLEKLKEYRKTHKYVRKPKLKPHPKYPIGGKKIKTKTTVKKKKGALGIFASLCILFDKKGIDKVTHQEAIKCAQQAKPDSNLSRGHFTWYKKKYNER